MPTPTPPPHVLIIAGLDPGGGAGLAADLKTLAALGCYGRAAVTAITVQNSREVRGISVLDAKLFQDQLNCLADDFPPLVIKIGMLGNAAIVEQVARFLERVQPEQVVLDPVLAASAGPELLDEKGKATLRRRLLPLAGIITPNLAEAAALSGLPVGTAEQMEPAARALHRLGSRQVIITGGHLEKPQDLYFDGEIASWLGGERVRTPHTHGAGCTFSTALAAYLAMRKPMPDAAVLAKAYVMAALRHAYPMGQGPGPLNHFFRLNENRINFDPAAPEDH